MANTTSIIVDSVQVDQASGHITVRVHSSTTDGVSTWLGPTRNYGLDASQFIIQFNSSIAQVTSWIASQHTAYNGANQTLTNSLTSLAGAAISGPALNPAATPSFSPSAGNYASGQAVAISCSSPGASIYYTTDGSTPTTSSTLYSAPITITSTETVKAIATATGFNTSAVATALFTIGLTAATPTFLPAAGSYTTVQSVAISCTTPGAVIYYTTDGSTPTTSSTLYTGAIGVYGSETIKAIATASGYLNSAVGTAAYIINA